MSSFSILAKTRLGDLIKNKQELIQVDTKDTLEKVLQLLNDKNILAAPVFDAKKNQYVGIVDVFDIMTMIALGSFFSDLIEQPDRNELESARFKTTTLADLLEDIERPKNIATFDSNDTLESVIEPMGSNGIRRVLVKSGNDQSLKYHVLTQTDVIKFILQNLGDFGEKLNLPIKQWELGFEKIVQVPNLVVASVNTKALEVYQRMWSEGVSAVPVVDESGKMVTTVSPSDLKHLTADKLKSILLPVKDFLTVMNSGYKTTKAVSCGTKSIMKDVLSKAVNSHVHRVWVLDSSEKPIGVVSFTDIINKLNEETRR